MSALTLVLGGARSGKSRYAERLVEAHPAPWVYVATAQSFDDEMAERIAHHRERRGAGWQTVEAPFDLAEVVRAAPPDAPLLVDCLTLWLTNLMLADRDWETVAADLDAACAGRSGPTILVSSEVGFGIVPENALARRFRDAAGLVHQRLAARASRVVLMVAGLPLSVKDEG